MMPETNNTQVTQQPGRPECTTPPPHQHLHMDDKLSLIFENSIDVIYISCPDGHLTDINPAGVKFFGYSIEELLNMNLSTLYKDPGDRERFKQEIAVKGFVKDYELELVRSDGSYINVQLTANVIKDKDGIVVGYHGIIRDITENKKLEEQLRMAAKMESIGRLAGGIAHDFNNLLTIINGYAESLLKEKPEGKMKSGLTQILKAGEKSAALVEKILAFSRKQPAEPKIINPNDVILDMKKLVERIIGEHISLSVHLEEKLGYIIMDPSQLEQVILNLIVNARDAMPISGSLTIETANTRLDEHFAHQHPGAKVADYVELVVIDTGVGMDKTVLDKIFEPFFTTKKKGEGTGLGMATVYGIVKQNNGFITAFSEPGRGSIFTVYLPTCPKDHVTPKRTLNKLDQADFFGKTVLIAEDEYVVRKLAEAIFQAAGFRVLSAQDGEGAIKIAENESDNIHLFFTDVVMTGLTGTETAGRIKALHPETAVIFCSGYPDSRLQKLGIGNSDVHLVRKPYTRRELMEKVNEILN